LYGQPLFGGRGMVGIEKYREGRRREDRGPSCTGLEKKLLLALGIIIGLTICSVILGL
jgi:hypothetical protein